ncbi:hypothetical protein C8R45DRAFT_366633, partial [Mycena sanguinolenta]
LILYIGYHWSRPWNHSFVVFPFLQNGLFQLCFSRVGVWTIDHVEVIPNDDSDGQRAMSSLVSFLANEYLIDDITKDFAVENAENTVFNVKRFMGSDFSADDFARLPFTILNQDNPP